MIREEDLPTPPPLPSDHPTQRGRSRESVRIAVLFYLELLFGSIVIIVPASVMLKRIAGIQIFIVVFLTLFFLASLYRMFKRIAIDSKMRGKPRMESIAIFLVALILPAGVLVGYARGILKGNSVELERQLEAKKALLAIYRAEQVFKREFGKFTFNTRELPSMESEGTEAHYIIGFPTVCTVKYGADAVKAQLLMDDPAFLRAKKLEIHDFFKNVRRGEECPNPTEGFEAYAVGLIREGAPLDVWRIDQNRKLENVRPGVLVR